MMFQIIVIGMMRKRKNIFIKIKFNFLKQRKIKRKRKSFEEKFGNQKLSKANLGTKNIAWF